MRSAQVLNRLPEMIPGQVYMHFLPKKNRHWPVKLVQILEHQSQTKRPLKARFEVLNGSYKCTRDKIHLDLKTTSPDQLVAFGSVQYKQLQLQHVKKSGSKYKKVQNEYQNAMKEAKIIFQRLLNTPFMYHTLKNQAKMKVKNQNTNIQSQSPFTQVFSEEPQLSHTQRLHNNPESENPSKRTQIIPNLKNQDKINFNKNSQNFVPVRSSQRFNQPSKDSQSMSAKESQSRQYTEKSSKKQPNSKKSIKIQQKISKKDNAVFEFSFECFDSSSSVRSQKYQNKPNDMKRGHTEVLKNDGSIKSLESPKKKRRSSKDNVAIVKVEKEQDSNMSKILSSQSQFAKRSLRQSSKKIEQKSQKVIQKKNSTLMQQYSSSVSKLSRPIQENNKSMHPVNEKTQEQKPYAKQKPCKKMTHSKIYPSLVSNKNQNIQFQDSRDFTISKSEALWNNTESSTKAAPNSSRKMNQLQRETKIEPYRNRTVKIEVSSEKSEKSVVSSRTRSKKLLNQNIKPLQTKRKRKLSPQISAKLKLSVLKKETDQKSQKQNHTDKVEKNHVSAKNKYIPFLVLPLKPARKIFKQTEIYTSQSGEKLNVQSLFLIFQSLFGDSNMKNNQTIKPKRGGKTKKEHWDKDKNSNLRIYSCLVNQETAKQIEKQHKQIHLINLHQSQQGLDKKQEESEEQIFKAKNEESFDDDDQLLSNLPTKPNLLQNCPIKNAVKMQTIIEEKNQKKQQSKYLSKKMITSKVKNEKVKNEQLDSSFDGPITTDTVNTMQSSKYHIQTQRLSVKYRMNLIQSFDDLISLIQKQTLQQKINDTNCCLISNQMDLQVNGSQSCFQASKNQKFILLVIQKDLYNGSQSCQITSVSKTKIIKKRSNKRSKITTKIHINTQSQSSETNKSSNNSLEQIIFAWPVQKLIFHGLFAQIKNLHFSVALNQHFINDLIQYNGSQDKFFTSILSNFNSVKGETDFESDQKSLISNTIMTSISSKNSKNKKNSCPSLSKNHKNSISNQLKSRISPNKTSRTHQFCAKISPQIKKILQQIQELFDMEFNFSEFLQTYQNYKNFIAKQTEFIFNQFQMNFKTQKGNKEPLFLDQNTFKQNCFNIFSKSFKQGNFQNNFACHYAQILNVLMKVLHIFSEEKSNIQSLENNQNNLNSEKLAQKEIKDHNSLRNSQKSTRKSKRIKSNGKNSKIQLNNVIKHPDQKRFAQVTTSPFTIQMDDDDQEKGSITTSEQSLNSSGVTEFSRNTSDFTSFLSNILPNVDVDKHKGNFKKSKQQIFDSCHTQISKSEVSSIKQYSQKINQKQGNMDQNYLDKFKNLSNPSSTSAWVSNNSKFQGINDSKVMTFCASNQVQMNSNTNKVKNFQEHEEQVLFGQKSSQLMETSEYESIELLKGEIYEVLDRLEAEESTLISMQT